MRSFDTHNYQPIPAVSPAFFSPDHRKNVLRRKEGDWMQDKNGDMFFKTKKEAESRKKALQKKGEWSEFKVESFDRNGTTLWRVLMRGSTSDKKKTDDVSKKGEAMEKKEETKTPVPSAVDPTFALTFDDGPHAAELGKGINRTENVLDVLKSEGIKAAFFIQTGVSFRGASANGKKLVKRMASDGHTVGVHTGGTIDHEEHPTAESKGALKGELEAGKKYIHEQTGNDPNFVRPPKGIANKAVETTYKKVGLTDLRWDIDGDQGANLDIGTLEKRLDAGITDAQTHGWKPWVQKASSKIVILYHDIQKGTANNIAALIKFIRDGVKKLGGGTARFGKP